jgi:aminoglycoside phosphotransferase (APT) family kinase protein
VVDDARATIADVTAELEPEGTVVDVRPLTGGVSAQVLGVEIATRRGDLRQVVFRRHRAGAVKSHGPTVAAKEFGVLRALHASGLAVPEPYLHGGGGSGGDPYLVMEWVDGSTALGDGELPGALDQMAAFLVELHALDPLSMQLPALEPVEDPRTGVVPYLPSTELGREVAARLASDGTRPHPVRPVLLHGDYWPGNVLWRDGRLVAVLDWEDVAVGDPLADLATARVELLCEYGHDAMASFTDRYVAGFEERIGPLPLAGLPVWEIYVSAAALSAMGTWGLAPEDEARRRERTGAFLERAARELG